MKLKGLLPALAALFSSTVVAMCVHYLGLLFPPFAVPFWLGFVVLLSALESAYFAAHYLNRRTPFLVRIVELALWLGPLYFLADRVLQVFLVYSGVVFAGWVISRGYGSQLAFMERMADYLGDQGAATVNWEYESLASRDSGGAPLRFFWWRLGFYGVLMSLLAIACRTANISFTKVELVYSRVLGSMALGSGLALQGGAYLFRLQILWSHAKADVSPALGRMWARGLLALLLLVVLVVNVAPVDYWPLTAQRIGEMMRGLVRGPTLFPSPLDYSEAGPVFQEEQDLAFPEEVAIGPWGLLVAAGVFLVFAGVGFFFLVVMGFIITQMIGAEFERLRGLPRLAVQVYLGMRNALRRLLHRMRSVRARLPVLVRRQRVKESEDTLIDLGSQDRRPMPKGVRAMFRRIAKEGGKTGLRFSPTLTALEYGRILHHNLPKVEPAVDEFLAGYQKVRYSNQESSPSDQARLLAVGTEIIEEIKNLRREESHGTGIRQ